MHKFVVTGCAGLIGSWIAEALLKQGHKVLGIDSFIGGYYDTIQGLVGFDNFEFAQLDVRDFKLINQRIKEFGGCDYVYHCAALAHEGLSVFSPTEITDSIVTGTTSVMSAAINNGLKRFINFSSMARYGEGDPVSPNTPFKESFRPKPKDPYAVAKVCAEQQVEILSSLHGTKYIHAVPHNCIGPRQKYNDPYRNVIAIWANLMLQNQQPIIYGSGEQKRCFSFIQDDIEMYMKLWDYPLDNKLGDIFNIGPDHEQGISMNNLVELVAKEMNFQLRVNLDMTKGWRQNARHGEVKVALCSSEKIKRDLGYKQKISLEEGIKSVCDYVKSKGPLDFDYYIDIEIDKENCSQTWKNDFFNKHKK